jgi:hypothetical protein
MSNKEECLVCKAYLTSVYDAFMRGEPCPHCGSSCETTTLLRRVESKRKELLRVSADKDLVEENCKLKNEVILANSEKERALRYFMKTSWHMEEALKILRGENT